jgi:hypothetical protein
MNSKLWILPRYQRGVRFMTKTVPQTTLGQVMASASKDGTLTSVAAMAGLSQRAVAQIVQTGLPMMAREADDDPLIFNALFQKTRQPLSPRPEGYYQILKNDGSAQRTLDEAFRAVYGPLTDSFNREASRQANTTEQKAGQVLAVTMPVLVKALASLNTQRNEMGFGRLLRRLRAELLPKTA